MTYQFLQQVKINGKVYPVGIREVPQAHEDHRDFELHVRAGYIADVDAAQIAAQATPTADRARRLHERMVARKQTSVQAPPAPEPEPVREPLQEHDLEDETDPDAEANEQAEDEAEQAANDELAKDEADAAVDSEGEEPQDGEEAPEAEAPAKPRRNRAKKTVKGT